MGNIKLPTGFLMRPPTMADIPACVNLSNNALAVQQGIRPYNFASVQATWTTPHLNIQTNFCVVENAYKEIVGLITFWDLVAPPTSIYIWGCVHPLYEGQGIGSALLQWVEQRAQQSIAQCPPHSEVSLFALAVDRYRPSNKLLKKLGFHFVRQQWDMGITFFDEPIQSTPLPAGISLTHYHHDTDLLPLYRAQAEAFQDHWNPHAPAEEEGLAQWRHRIATIQDFDPQLWFLAKDGDEIAGICLCRPHADDDPDMGYISHVAVRRPWRRQGLGLALVKHALMVLQQQGKTGAMLKVDAKNPTGATRVYEKAGMSIVHRQNRYQKIIRPAS